MCDGGTLIRNPAIWAWRSKGRIAPRTSDPGFVFEDVEGETTLLERPVGLRADVEITYVGQTCIEDGEKRALGLHSAQNDADLVVLLVFNEATFALEDPLLAELSEDIEHPYNQRQWGEVASESQRPEEKLLRHGWRRGHFFFFRIFFFFGMLQDMPADVMMLLVVRVLGKMGEREQELIQKMIDLKKKAAALRIQVRYWKWKQRKQRNHIRWLYGKYCRPATK